MPLPSNLDAPGGSHMINMQSVHRAAWLSAGVVLLAGAWQMSDADVRAGIGSHAIVPPSSNPTGPPTLSTKGAPFKGRRDASVVIVEFSDFDCAFCRRHAITTLPLLESQYVIPGKVRYVFRHFPLPGHRSAARTHRAAQCAAERGGFWEAHGALFNRAGRVEDPLALVARTVGAAVAAIERCAAEPGSDDTVRRDVQEGRSLSISGTPAFFIGFADRGSDDVRVRTVVTGAKRFPVFQRVLDSLLDESRRSQ